MAQFSFNNWLEGGRQNCQIQSPSPTLKPEIVDECIVSESNLDQALALKIVPISILITFSNLLDLCHCRLPSTHKAVVNSQTSSSQSAILFLKSFPSPVDVLVFESFAEFPTSIKMLLVQS